MVYEDQMLADYDDKKDWVLEDLQFSKMTRMKVEVKNSDEVFEPFNPNNITLKINKWRENIIGIEELQLQPDK